MSGLTCIVLTGGAATRLQPLTYDRSKGMLPFLGRPLLHYLVRDLGRAGIEDVWFTSAGREADIRHYFQNGAGYGVRIRYFDFGRGAWPGTAGVIRSALGGALRSQVTDPFLLVYGDSLLVADLRGLVSRHESTRPLATILSHNPRFDSFLEERAGEDPPEEDRRTNFGVLDVAPDGSITKFAEKPRIVDIARLFRRPAANAAVYVLSHRVFDLVDPPNGTFDFGFHLFPGLLDAGFPIGWYDIGDGYRIDVGTIPNYVSTQLAVLRNVIPFSIDVPTASEGVWIGDQSEVDDGAKLVPPVFLADSVRVRTGATVEGAVLSEEVEIGRSSNVSSSILLERSRVGERATITSSVLGDKVSVRDGASMAPNTIMDRRHGEVVLPEIILPDESIRLLVRGVGRPAPD